MRAFMLRQTKVRDLAVFARVAHRAPGEAPEDAPLTVLVPAFVVGELRSAFAIGVALYLPFVAIDLAVSAILMGLPIMSKRAYQRGVRALVLSDSLLGGCARAA
jgi:flagellar biosynthetic protein FliP